MIDVTFFMEQHIGHYAYYENLRDSINRHPDIRATWIPVTYTNSQSIWQRLPLLPAGVRGTLIGRGQVRQGLKKKGDVRFFNTQVPAVIAGNMSRNPPYVLATDITPLQYDAMGSYYDHRNGGRGIVSDYKHRQNVKTFQNAAYILPWSSWAGKSLVADYGVDDQKIKVIAPGVNLETWRPAIMSESHPIRILFVGGDLVRKGGLVLLEAFQELSKIFPSDQLELLLVTRSAVQPARGVSVFSNCLPNSPELIRLYQSSDLFVLPSYAEAFGIAAVEATASGLPVLATNIGGLTDIVEDGKNGFFIEPGEVKPLLEKLVYLVENPDIRHEMSRASRARAEQYFDASRNAAQISQILHDVAQ